MFTVGKDGYHDNKCVKEHGYVLSTDKDKLVRVDLPRAINSGKRFFGLEYEVELDASEYGLGPAMCECYECNGSGETTSTCEYCDGTGYMTVSDYDEDGNVKLDEDGNEITHEVECEECGGSGEITTECEYCNGSGEVESDDDDAEVDMDMFTFSDDLRNTFVMENDGSLDFGFELVTEPLTKHAMNWFLSHPDIENVAKAGHSGNNGIHIHVTRPDDEVIRRLRVIMASLSMDLMRATRSSDYAKWYHSVYKPEINDIRSSFSNGESLKVMDIVSLVNRLERGSLDPRISGFREIKRILSTLGTDRYLCMNETNVRYNTLEFRFFNWTSKLERVKQYIEFVDTIMDLAYNNTEKDLLKGTLTLDNETLAVTFTPKTKKNNRYYYNVPMYKDKDSQAVNDDFTLLASAPTYNGYYSMGYSRYLKNEETMKEALAKNAEMGYALSSTICMIDREATKYDPKDTSFVRGMGDTDFFRIKRMSNNEGVVFGVVCDKYGNEAGGEYYFDLGWVLGYKNIDINNRIVVDYSKKYIIV